MGFWFLGNGYLSNKTIKHCKAICLIIKISTDQSNTKLMSKFKQEMLLGLLCVNNFILKKTSYYTNQTTWPRKLSRFFTQ